MNFIKIGFNSDIAKLLSERANLLSWAIGGINYIGFNVTGATKFAITVIFWLFFQYLSLALFRVSNTLKEEEKYNNEYKENI